MTKLRIRFYNAYVNCMPKIKLNKLCWVKTSLYGSCISQWPLVPKHMAFTDGKKVVR